MVMNEENAIGFLQVRAVSLAVTDLGRARLFYGETLGLEPADGVEGAFVLGEVIILLKPVTEWYGKPSSELNARITLRVRDSYGAEKALAAKGVTISDPVQVYDVNPVGSFLDSEGNKLWFCSDPKLG